MDKVETTGWLAIVSHLHPLSIASLGVSWRAGKYSDDLNFLRVLEIASVYNN